MPACRCTPSDCRVICSRAIRTIPARFAEFLHALAERGVDIYITEFDVRDDTFPDDVPTRDAMIADTAEKFLTNVLRVPAVKVVIAWELADNYSFYTRRREEEGSARAKAAAAAAVRFVDAKKAALVCHGARLRERETGPSRLAARAPFRLRVLRARAEHPEQRRRVENGKRCEISCGAGPDMRDKIDELSALPEKA